MWIPHPITEAAGGQWAPFYWLPTKWSVVKSLRDSKGNCASCISESEKKEKRISYQAFHPFSYIFFWQIDGQVYMYEITEFRKGKSSYLFLRETITPSVFADLVTFLVPTRSTIATVVFPLAAWTLPTSLSFLLRRLLVGVRVVPPAGQTSILRFSPILYEHYQDYFYLLTCWVERCANSSPASPTHCQTGRQAAWMLRLDLCTESM